MTSAGLSAGIDLTLHVIRADHRAACADRVAPPRQRQPTHLRPPLPRRQRDDAAAALLSRRVLVARCLLEESNLPVETVALRAAFGNAASLGDHFRRATATTRPPTAAPSSPSA
jgi:transcriptional regulator GlxA family with amidase domain